MVDSLIPLCAHGHLLIRESISPISPSSDLAAWPTCVRCRIGEQPGDSECCAAVRLDAGQRFRVLDVVRFEEEDESPFVGLLKVEAA